MCEFGSRGADRAEGSARFMGKLGGLVRLAWFIFCFVFVLIDIEQDWRAGGVKKGRIES